MEEKEIHLQDYLRVVLKRKHIVLTFFVVTVLVVFLGSLKSTPLYTATIRIKVEKKTKDPLRNLYNYRSYDPEFVGSQTQIISSRAVTEKLVELLDLEENYQYFFPEKEDRSSLLASLKTMVKKRLRFILSPFRAQEASPDDAQLTAKALPEALRPAEKTRTSQLAATLAGGLKISRVPESNILSVSYTSRNPEFSALICNNLPKAYIERLLEMRMEDTEYSLEWMKKKAQTEREKLEATEHRLQRYLKAQDIVTIEDRIALIPERLSQLSRELTRVETQREELKALVDKINKTPVTQLDTLSAIADEKPIQEIRQQILAEEQNILSLSQKYGPKHPVRIQAEKNLEKLREKMATEMTRLARKIKNQYELTQANEANLRQQLDATKTEASRLNEKAVQYNIIKREITTKQQLYEALVSRIKEQAMTKQTREVSVSVVEKARVPAGPANQNARRNLLLAMILGCFGGIGLAFFLEYLDNTVSVPEDAQAKTGLPALAGIPQIDVKQKAPESVVLDYPDSVEAEAYKSLRTALSLSTTEGFPRSLVISSIAPGDGKTSTCANLAVTIAQTERSVLIIDSDLRRPNIHKVFNLKREKGLAEVLTGACEAREAIVPSEVPHLDILPAGNAPPNPSELLAAERTAGLIKDLVSRYEVVLLDSPPAGTVSDSIILTGYAAKVLLVTRSGVTKYEAIGSCLENFRESREKVIGQVVNAVNLKKEGYYYYSPYAYQYSHYYLNQ